MGSLALPILFGGIQAYSAYNQGRSQEAAYNAQAATDEANARNKEIERENVNNQASLEMQREAARARIIEGSNIAAAGAGGITQDSGSLQDMSNANFLQKTANEEIIRANLFNRDLGIRQDQANLLNAAAQKRSAARSARRSGILSAVTSVLGTAISLKGFGGSSAASGNVTAPNLQYNYGTGNFMSGSQVANNSAWLSGDYNGWLKGTLNNNPYRLY